MNLYLVVIVSEFKHLVIKNKLLILKYVGVTWNLPYYSNLTMAI